MDLPLRARAGLAVDNQVSHGADAVVCAIRSFA